MQVKLTRPANVIFGVVVHGPADGDVGWRLEVGTVEDVCLCRTAGRGLKPWRKKIPNSLQMRLLQPMKQQHAHAEMTNNRNMLLCFWLSFIWRHNLSPRRKLGRTTMSPSPALSRPGPAAPYKQNSYDKPIIRYKRKGKKNKEEVNSIVLCDREKRTKKMRKAEDVMNKREKMNKRFVIHVQMWNLQAKWNSSFHFLT